MKIIDNKPYSAETVSVRHGIRKDLLTWCIVFLRCVMGMRMMGTERFRVTPHEQFINQRVNVTFTCNWIRAFNRIGKCEEGLRLQVIKILFEG